VPVVVDLAGQLGRYRSLGFEVPDIGFGDVPDDAVLVFPHTIVPFPELITRLHLADSDKPGIFDRNFEDPSRYHPVDQTVSRDRPYLVYGFEPGVEYLNLRPRDAVPRILERGRLPLTIEEGLAVFAQNPSYLQRNKCFSLAGSTRGDKRVPALWISGNAPKLGWCFAGAPHTWLGTASVTGRLALS
jgi:Family of unknown function (DUF5701)